ncbi:hypothetical protein AL538_00140 [Vibrio harveyi]|uniref:Pilus assembly protein E-set like domain-containing protein n=1 Tax=Vibrio harveyi TaxID=669 RepID=A0ABM5XT47_VIBHA|nr:hypothetical protein AL538_00140 [Vibrio harveyi]
MPRFLTLSFFVLFSCKTFAIPEEFLDLRESIVFSNVYVLGRSLGNFEISLSEEKIKFKEIESTFNKLGLKDTFYSKLKNLNKEGFSYIITNKSCGGNIDDIKVYFNNNNADVRICLPKRAIDTKKSANTVEVTKSSGALITSQTINVSVRDYDNYNLSLDQSLAVGFDHNSYIYSDYRVDSSENINHVFLDESYLSYKFANYKTLIGKISYGENSASILSEGILHSKNITGLRFTNVDDLNSSSTTSSSYIIILDKSSTVQFFRSGSLIYTTYMDSGVNVVNTDSFPYGTYDIEAKIFQRGKYVRSELSSFYKFRTGTSNKNSGDFMLQLGVDEEKKMSTQLFYQKYLAHGFRLGMSADISESNESIAQLGGDFDYSAVSINGNVGFYILTNNSGEKKYKTITNVNYNGWNVYLNVEKKDSYCEITNITCLSDSGYNENLNITKQFEGVSLSFAQQKSNSYDRLSFSASSNFNYGGWSFLPQVTVFSSSDSNEKNGDQGISIELSLSKITDDNSQFNAGFRLNDSSLESNVYYENPLEGSSDSKLTFRGSTARLSNGELSHSVEVGGETQGRLGKLNLTGALYKNGMQSSHIYGSYSSNSVLYQDGFRVSSYYAGADTLSGIVFDSNAQKSGRDENSSYVVNSSTGSREKLFGDGSEFLPVSPNKEEKLSISQNNSVDGYQIDSTLNSKNVVVIPRGRVVKQKVKLTRKILIFGNLKNLIGQSLVTKDSVTEVQSNGDFSFEADHVPKKIFSINEKGRLSSYPIVNINEISSGVYRIYEVYG